MRKELSLAACCAGRRGQESKKNEKKRKKGGQERRREDVLPIVDVLSPPSFMVTFSSLGVY